MDSPRRTRLTEADKRVWASYAGRVRPLPGRPQIAPEIQPAMPMQSRLGATPHTRRAPLLPLVVGTQPGGVDAASWQRLRTGRRTVERRLDLHGHTAQRAFHALAAFLHSAQGEGLRCVEVITGQGGVLRRELPLWLNLPEFRSLVLAAAHPHAANPGAVRLLLRRLR